MISPTQTRRNTSLKTTTIFSLLATLLLFAGCSSPDEQPNIHPDNNSITDTGNNDSSNTDDTNTDDTNTTQQDAAPTDTDSTNDVDPTKDTDNSDTPPPSTDPFTLKLIALNDFHGRLEAPSGKVSHAGTTVDAGGVAFMKAYVDELRKGAEHSIVVAAGDLVGASPLISSMFHDEPSIEALNQLGLEISAVGNHEFDASWSELLRLQTGGCHANGCTDESNPYKGAKFQYLAANVVKQDGKTLLPATEIKTYNGVKVGFIGIVLEETNQITLPSATAGLTFRKESDVINEQTALLQAQGIETIIVLIHEGGQPTANQPTLSDCGDMRGPIVDIVKQSSTAVDVFVTGHTHQTYICDIEGKLVTSGYSYGRVLTEIDLVIDPATGDVTSKTAQNHIVHNDKLAADPDMATLVHYYAQLTAAADPVVGQITKTISYFQSGNAGESPMGNLVTDSHLYATTPPGEGGAQIAFANAGGIRANISSTGATATNPGDVLYSQLHAVLPFGNTLVTVTITGAQIHQLLEQQFSATEYSILHVSKGFSYTFKASAPLGQHIDPATIKLNGTTINPTTEYRVTVNSFMAEGGGSLNVLKQGTNRLQGPSELAMFAQYFQAHSPITAPKPNRITQIP